MSFIQKILDALNMNSSKKKASHPDNSKPKKQSDILYKDRFDEEISDKVITYPN